MQLVYVGFICFESSQTGSLLWLLVQRSPPLPTADVILVLLLGLTCHTPGFS